MAAFFTLLLGMASVLIGYMLYDFSRENFIRETQAAINSEIQHIGAATRKMSQAERATFIRRLGGEAVHPVYYYQDESGTRLAGNIRTLPEEVETIREGLLGFSLMQEESERSFAAKLYTYPDNSRLFVARDIDGIMNTYHRLQWFSVLIILFMIIVVLVSFYISTFVVNRINTIAETARQIMETGDLSQRIAVDSRWDDLSNLAFVLNDMFARIDTLMQGIRDVSDNIAHDLRTPLTRLKHQLEEAEKHGMDQHHATKMLEEADGLLGTFNALLRIANIEKGRRHQAFECLSAAALLQDVVELYEPLIEEKKLTLTTEYDESAHIQGDRDLLFQVCANIMDNAIKFSPQGGAVGIHVTQNKDDVMVVISDSGIGIAPEERERVFDRFYRSDTSCHTPGNGLGLSLVKAALVLHDASILLEDGNPGLRVVICFPAANITDS